MDYSVKSDTRQKRLDQLKQSHLHTFSSPLPGKVIALKVTDTKETAN